MATGVRFRASSVTLRAAASYKFVVVRVTAFLFVWACVAVRGGGSVRDSFVTALQGEGPNLSELDIDMMMMLMMNPKRPLPFVFVEATHRSRCLCLFRINVN